MAARSSPESGDVIVREAHHAGRSRYLLSTLGFPSQISIETYAKAVRHALSYARSERTRAWIVIDSGEAVLLTDHLESGDSRSDTALERLRSEFLEMPGLQLTVTQAQRLCGIHPAVCLAMLDALVETRFLSLTGDGRYVRRTDETAGAAQRRVART